MAKTAGSLVIALNAEDPLNRTVLACGDIKSATSEYCFALSE